MKHYKSGFTLIEIVIVIIIIGVLASIAIPKYSATMERIRSSEGVNILTALMGAQKRYAMENGGVYTATLTDLDITIPAPANFNAISDASLSTTAASIATVTRNNNSFGNYTLTISDLGVITCAGGSGNICTKMGY